MIYSVTRSRNVAIKKGLSQNSSFFNKLNKCLKSWNRHQSSNQNKCQSYENEFTPTKTENCLKCHTETWGFSSTFAIWWTRVFIAGLGFD